MERIRVGNNIAISWALYELNGRIHNLEGKDLQLYMACGGYKVYVTDYTIQGNVISWVFLGSEQTKTGDYKLVLVETDPLSGASAFDVKEAFRLTPNDVVGPDVVIGPANVSVRSVLTYSNLVGVESIDVVESTEDDGVNIVTIHLVDGKDATITVKNGSKGDKGDKGDIGATGPKGDKGDTGERGEPGVATASAGVIDPTAVGTPTVDVTLRDKNIDFKFGNLKGEKGDKGDQGNTGSSVDYPYELVNNLTADDATKGLSAGMGKVLKDEIDEKTVFDISAYHSGSTYATFVLAVADIPSDFQKGGMVIKYKDQTTGKYVQYRLLATSFSDVQSDWALDSEATIEDNPEFVEVHTDSQDKVLYGVKSDGDFHFGSGCPSQVKDAIAKAATTKVDKVDGKSLIDEDVADSVGYQQESPEFVEVKVDANDRVLEGTQTDGTKVIGGDAKIGGSASVEGNARVLGSVELSGAIYDLIESPEWAHALLDADGKVVCGIKWDGKFYADIAGVPSEASDTINRLQEQIDALGTSLDARIQVFEEIFSVVDNPEFIQVTTDSEGKILQSRNPEGVNKEHVGFETPILSVDGATIENIQDPEGRTEIKTDSVGKILSYRDVEGVMHEEVGIKTKNIELSETGLSDLSIALRAGGYLGMNNWSNESYIYLPEQPKCAVINISGIDSMPVTKTDDLKAYMEVWDKLGNYFKKKVILNAQGRSSLNQTKKNFAADFCEDEWKGDDTTTIKIGDWVSQDSFHFKACYTDMFKIANVISYKIWDSWKVTLPVTEDRPYKEYFGDSYSPTTDNISDFTQNAKDEARCVPDGFPVMVYLNGEFYGLFSWQLKKHRDNYFLDRNSTDNIHLDGEDYINLFSGIINWNLVEIRNPKPKKSKWTLTCMDGTKYDGDDPKELIDDTSDKWDGSNISHVKSAQVKANIIALSQYMSEISGYETAYNNASPEDKPAALATLKAEIEKRFGVKWLIDYVILINLAVNGDSYNNNTQWVTWGKLNGKMKWSPCPYDLDAGFGIISTTSFNFGEPSYKRIGNTENTPLKFVYSYYIDEYKTRWKELRDKKLISKDFIISRIKDWINAIGFDNLELEYGKWNESPCNRDSLINSKWNYTGVAFITYSDIPTSWNPEYTFVTGDMVKYQHGCYRSLQDNNLLHEPVVGQDTEWWEYLGAKAKTYSQGEIVWDGYSNFYAFEATETITVSTDAASERQDSLVNTPFEKFYSSYPREGGVHDSIYRLYKWIESQINLMDVALDYNQS